MGQSSMGGLRKGGARLNKALKGRKRSQREEVRGFCMIRKKRTGIYQGKTTLRFWGDDGLSKCGRKFACYTEDKTTPLKDSFRFGRKGKGGGQRKDAESLEKKSERGGTCGGFRERRGGGFNGRKKETDQLNPPLRELPATRLPLDL